MNPVRRSDRSFSYYSAQETEKTHEQKEARVRDSAVQGRARLQSVHSSHVRPSTSASYRDRSPLERDHSDVFLQRLNDVLVKMDLFGDRYMGGLHASWVRQLYLETRGQTSANKKMKYIDALHSSIHSIKYWSIEATINFYLNMTKMHLFVDINEFNDSCRSKSEEIHDELINVMTKKLSILGILNENNLNIYIGLFWSISNSFFIKNTEKGRLLAKNLVKQVTNIFLSYQKLLTPYLYNEVTNYISRLIKIKEYRNIFNALMEMHLIEISDLNNSKETNVEFAKFLCNFVNALENSFAFVSLEKNIEKLITKIDFSININQAYLGLHSITKYLLKSELSLSKEIHKKIKECLSFIEKNKKNLNLNSSISVAVSLSVLFSKVKKIPDEYLEILNLCLRNLEINKDRLTLEELNKLLQIVRNLSTANVSFFKFLLLASNVFENKNNDFYTLPQRELHSFFCKFGPVTKAMILKDTKQYLSIKPKFSVALKDLTKRYSEYLFSAGLFEKINGYRTLSTIAVSGFQPNASIRDILRDLFYSMDKNEKLLHVSNNDLLSFLNATMKLGNLINLNLDKYTEIFITHTKKIIENNETEAKKSLMLWSLLVFFVMNRKQLDENKNKKLNHAIRKLYLNLKNADVKIDDSTLSIVEFWLEIEQEVKCIHKSNISLTQSRILKKLRTQFRNECFETEVSIKNLPPCDIIIPSRDIVIEVQGPYHFLDSNNRYKTGSTLLKLESYRKAGFKVIEVCVDGDHEKETRYVESCMKIIRDIVSKPKFS